MKTIVVAYDKNHGIGANGDLLWKRDLPADLQHFKKTTLNGAIVMGYNTYKSIGRPLPGRRNIVIDRQQESIAGFDVVDSLQSAYDLAGPNQDLFIIGGGHIFVESIDSVDRIISTEVDALFDEATVFFPKIDPKVWLEKSRVTNPADERNLYNYDFVVYERR